jgi:hypothetical protein
MFRANLQAEFDVHSDEKSMSFTDMPRGAQTRGSVTRKKATMGVPTAAAR